MGCFINFSNHPSNNWSVYQKETAEKYGEIIDISFPNVEPEMDEAGIEKLAEECYEKIKNSNPAAVMCQGEFGLSYKVIQLLKKDNYKVLYACSKRETIEEKRDDGSISKSSIFRFVKFREY